MKNPNRLAWIPVALAHVAAAAIAALLLLSVGQPVFTDDLWWHLALGEAYAKEGPWLAADPILFEAAGPPKPNAWLSDLLFYGVERGFGFTGLRLFHAVMVGLALVGALSGPAPVPHQAGWRGRRQLADWGAWAGGGVGPVLFLSLAGAHRVSRFPFRAGGLTGTRLARDWTREILTWVDCT